MTSFLIAGITAGAVTTFVTVTVCASLIARMGFPLPEVGRRIGYIDGLRGYLAISVLIHHFIYWIWISRLNGSWDRLPVYVFNQLGEGAVSLFFMITGCVFYPKLLTGFRSCSWFKIYTTRFFRITPLVAVSVIFVTIIIMARTGRSLDSDFPIAALAWITTWGEPPLLAYPESWRLNADVLWSLRYEWLFYLLVLPACALAMDLMQNRLPSWIVPFALLAATLGARVLHVGGSLVFYLPLFAIGMLAYELQRRDKIVRVLRTPAMTIVTLGALGLGLFGSFMPYNITTLLLGLFFGCVACGNSLGGLLRTRGALVLGECSYGIYLLHGIVLSVLFVDAHKLTVAFKTDYLPVYLPISAIMVTFLTSVTYLAVERPAIKTGKRLAKQWTGSRLHMNTPNLEGAP